MIAVVSDTHRTEGHGLSGRTLAAVRTADRVIHAGDFTTAAVLAAFRAEGERVDAVHGNRDTAEVRAALPARRIVDVAGLRIAIVHGHEHSETALALFGREAGADLVVSGHSHRPDVTDAGDVWLLNPGSHAQPRGSRPGHAELERVGDGVRGRLREPDGTVFEEFAIGEGRNAGGG